MAQEFLLMIASLRTQMLFSPDLRPRGPLQVSVWGVREARRATALPEPRRRRQAVRRHRRHREEPHAPGIKQDAYTQRDL